MLGRPRATLGGMLDAGTGPRFRDAFGSTGGTGGLKSSSRGGMMIGFGIPFALEMTFALEPAISGRRDSSSLRSWRSYMTDDRVYSMRAVVISSVTSRRWVCSARCRFWEMPSARRTRTCSYLFA